MSLSEFRIIKIHSCSKVRPSSESIFAGIEEQVFEVDMTVSIGGLIKRDNYIFCASELDGIIDPDNLNITYISNYELKGYKK